MADTPLPMENTFRVEDGKYIHNNEELTKEEFDKRKNAVDERVQELRGKRETPAPGAPRRSMEDRKSKAFDELNMKKGGKVRTASQRADGIAIRGKTRA